MDSARNKTENRKPTKHIKVWDVQTMGNRLFEIFWQQCHTHILKSKSQEPSLDLSLSESSGSRTTEECQVKATGGISRLNHNRSFLEGGNQSSAFWTITFVWCQVRTTVAPGELWLIIYLCNPKGSWMYMVPSPVGWQIKIYPSWWWIVLDLQQFGGLLYTQLAKPGTLGGHRQAPGWRGSRVEYGLSRNEEHWRTMDRETVMFFLLHGTLGLSSAGVSDVSMELTYRISCQAPRWVKCEVNWRVKLQICGSQGSQLSVPHVFLGGPAGSQPLQFQLLRSQELGTLPIQLVPCTFWDVLRRLTSSSWRSRGSCNVNLKWRSSVAAHRHSFRSFVGRIKKTEHFSFAATWGRNFSESGSMNFGRWRCTWAWMGSGHLGSDVQDGSRCTMLQPSFFHGSFEGETVKWRRKTRKVLIRVEFRIEA